MPMIFIIMEQFIKQLLREVLEDYSDTQRVFDFTTLPDDVEKTLDEYDNYTHKTFDWNDKMGELGQPEFSNWFEGHKNKVLSDNLDDIITKTTQDMILIKKRVISDKKLKAFEELIKPTIGNEALMPALSKFEEEVIMNPHATPEMIQKGFNDAKNIIDAEGNLDHSKIEKSNVFTGGDINLPQFERFANNNPEYMGVFEDWKKIFDENTELMIKNLHAYRDSTPIDRIRKLRDTLINIKKNKQ